MCAPDPNAGIRMQAKIEKQKKDIQFSAEKLKYWNREVGHKKGLARAGMGLSRDKSDAYSAAVFAVGKGRQLTAGYNKKMMALSREPGGYISQQTGTSFSRNKSLNKFKEILDKQQQVESRMNNTFGRNMDIAHQMITRNHMTQVAKNRATLGSRPEYGAPVMMPPRDTQGQMFANMQLGLSIAGLFSDIKLKENIKQVGESPSGHKVYEFNYIGNKTRYRGAMAQDVVKINPMAVGIRDNYLTVDYSKIDVDMEVVA